MLIVGFGDSLPGGLIGNLVGLAGLLLVDPDSGERGPGSPAWRWRTGSPAPPDGTIFASNDFGTHIDRVDPHGTVHRRWATVPSANGLAVDPGGRYLYAAQTFVPAAIKRVEIARPRQRHHPRPPRPARPRRRPRRPRRSMPPAASTWPPTAPVRSGASNPTATSRPRPRPQMPQRRRHRARRRRLL